MLVVVALHIDGARIGKPEVSAAVRAQHVRAKSVACVSLKFRLPTLIHRVVAPLPLLFGFAQTPSKYALWCVSLQEIRVCEGALGS